MSVLTREVRNIQNPALGAGLIWRFVCGYVVSHPTRDPAPLPILFLALPVVLHEKTEEFVSSTQQASGLRAFAAKFGKSENSKQDLLLAIHDRMLALRHLSMESIRLALATRLLHLDAATVIPLSETQAVAGIQPDVRRLMKSAEKLGVWCGSLTMHEITNTLKVRF
jgi:ABC-three component (ABC-3C) system Middle Component 3